MTKVTSYMSDKNPLQSLCVGSHLAFSAPRAHCCAGASKRTTEGRRERPDDSQRPLSRAHSRIAPSRPPSEPSDVPRRSSAFLTAAVGSWSLLLCAGCRSGSKAGSISGARRPRGKASGASSPPRRTNTRLDSTTRCVCERCTTTTITARAAPRRAAFHAPRHGAARVGSLVAAGRCARRAPSVTRPLDIQDREPVVVDRPTPPPPPPPQPPQPHPRSSSSCVSVTPPDPKRRAR